MTLPHLRDVPIGTMFRTAKWEDVFRATDPAAALGSMDRPTCMYLRCHCIYRVTGRVMTKMAMHAPKFRDVEIVWRCDTKARRHEDTHRTAKYRQDKRHLPMGTVNANARIVIIDPLTRALATELAA